MLKVEMVKGKTHVEVEGSLATICADISSLIQAINENLSKENEEAGKLFRVGFTKGFMDGVCFDCDRETMTGYLSDADDAERNHKKVTNEIVNGLRELKELVNRFLEDETDAVE